MTGTRLLRTAKQAVRAITLIDAPLIKIIDGFSSKRRTA